MTLGTFYRAPSVKRLMAELGLDREHANKVRALLHGAKQPDEYKSVQDWLRQCFHEPDYVEQLLVALNEVCDTCGVEYLGRENPDTYRERPKFAFLNTGDMYASTLFYSYENDSFYISSEGDLAERHRL